jgi:hypothetical protein
VPCIRKRALGCFCRRRTPELPWLGARSYAAACEPATTSDAWNTFPVRPNPKKLNALQLKTLAILQAIARQPALADPPEQDGAVSIHTLPHQHGDHLHVGAAVVSAREATGLGNPNVLNALARKGLLRHGSAGLPSLTLEGRNYQTGLDTTLLHGADH